MKFLLLHILHCINSDLTPITIAKRYGWSRQRLYYWVKKLKNAGLIRLKIRTNIAIYELTDEGKKFYTGYVSSLKNGIRLHNVAFSYDIKKLGNLEPQKIWELRGLLNRYKKLLNASVVWSDKTLTIHVSSLIGENAFALLDKAKNIADQIANQLKQYGFELEHGRLSRKPHFAILNPLMLKLAKQFEFSSINAKIDESEGIGELEFFDPRKVQEFIVLPETVDELRRTVENLLVPTLNELSKQINTHLKVMHEIDETMKKISDGISEMNNLIKELRKKS